VKKTDFSGTDCSSMEAIVGNESSEFAKGRREEKRMEKEKKAQSLLERR